MFWTRIKRMSRIFFCTRRREAQCWVLNVECWIVAACRNVELTNDEFRCSHEMFWTRDSPKAHWPQGGNNANDTNNYLHADLALYLKRTPIARMHVRVGTLTWGLLNENDTNEIKMDPIRGFVNTHCLCLVLEIESLYSFSPTIGKQAFIVLTYRKSSKSSLQYINQRFLDRKQSYFFLN